MDEQKYIEQIIAETGYQPTKEQLNYLNAMGEISRQEILLNLRNTMTSYGEMQPLPELLKSYGSNEQFIKTAQKEIAQWYWNNLEKIAEEGNKLTDFEMEHIFKFALDKLKELGLSDAEVNNAFMTDDHFKTGLALSDPDMRGEFDEFLKKNAGMSIFELEDSLNKVPDTAKGLDPEEDFNVAERAYEDKMADMAAREPSEAELNRYINSLTTADEGRIEAYNEMMASNTDNIDRPIVEEIETKNDLPKGSISKLGAVLDPISEGLEAGLRAAGLGSIATWWVKAEAANFLAGILRAGEGGLAQAQLGQSAALMGEKDIVSQTEENILSTAGQIFSQQMKFSPGMWFESKYAESDLGKGKTPTEQLYSVIKGLGR
jgi:hypothetical protein